MLKLGQNSEFKRATLFVAKFGVGLFMGNVKWRMYVDVASKRSNEFYIFKLFHLLMENVWPSIHSGTSPLGHLYSRDTLIQGTQNLIPEL